MSDVSGYAAVRRGRPGETDTCFAYGDTLAECKRSAQRQLQVPHNQAGCIRYYVAESTKPGVAGVRRVPTFLSGGEP